MSTTVFEPNQGRKSPVPELDPIPPIPETMSPMPAQESAVEVTFRIALAIFLPPLGVYAMSSWSKDLIVSVVLTLLGFIPGVIHGLYLTYVYYERHKMVFRGAIDFQNPPPAFGVTSRLILRGLNRDEPRLAHGPIEVQLDTLASQSTQNPDPAEEQPKNTTANVAPAAELPTNVSRAPELPTIEEISFRPSSDPGNLRAATMEDWDPSRPPPEARPWPGSDAATI